MSGRVRALVAGALLLAAVLPSNVSAGSLVREADVRTNLYCELEADGGTIVLYAESSDQWGTYGEVAIWSGPMSEPPDIITEAAELTVTPTGATGSFELVELVEGEESPFGDPAGSATLSATFSPIGDPEPYRFTDRDGNRTIRYEGVIQHYEVSGTLDVDLVDGPDGQYDLSGCFASTDTGTVAMSNPDAFVSGGERISVTCEWVTEDGVVHLFAGSDEWGAYSDLFMVVDETTFYGFGDTVLTPTGFEADYEIVDDQTWTPVGSASASATFTSTSERINVHDRHGNFKYNEVGRVLDVDGQLTVELASGTTTLVMDADSCQASHTRVREISTNPSGPKLKNDLPDGALPLALGSTIEVRTGGTAPEPEAPCTIAHDDHVDEIPISHTAWWTFTGTGDTVTIDTAGSTFDTVVGVYVLEGGEYVQVACVDDVFDPETGEGTLQSVVTVDTVAGTTYYVQAGGFAGATGTLVLRVE